MIRHPILSLPNPITDFIGNAHADVFAGKGGALAEPPCDTVKDLFVWTYLLVVVQRLLLAIMLHLVAEYPRASWQGCVLAADPKHQ